MAAEILDERRERQRRTESRRRDDVVSTPMTDCGQRVVLTTDDHVNAGRVTDAADERGLDSVGVPLDREAAFCQPVGDQR